MAEAQGSLFHSNAHTHSLSPPAWAACTEPPKATAHTLKRLPATLKPLATLPTPYTSTLVESQKGLPRPLLIPQMTEPH